MRRTDLINQGGTGLNSSFMNTYSVAFFAVAIILFLIIRKQSISIKPKNEKIFLILFLTSGFILRLILAPQVEGFSTDIAAFKSWATTAAESYSKFYSSTWCDYPPVYIFILGIIGDIVNNFGIASSPGLYLIMIKLPSMIADIITSYIIYKVASKEFRPAMALFLSNFYLFNPAVLINSTLWGQVDSLFTMLIVIALLLLKKEKKPLSTVVFTIAVLMKPQALIFIPVLGYELLVDLFKRKNYKNFIYSIAASLVTAVLILLPFSTGERSLLKNPLWIYDLFENTKNGYEYISLNAYNFFSFIGVNLEKDAEMAFLFSYGTWGYILAIIVALFTGYLFLKAKNSSVILIGAAVQIIGFFVFWTRMHERYMFPAIAVVMLAYIYLKDVRILALFAGASLTIFINSQDVLTRMMATNYPHIPPENMLLRVFSFVNVILFALLVWIAIDVVIRNKIISISFKDSIKPLNGTKIRKGHK